MKGKIVVDGVLASCYSSVDHDLADISMAPIRWIPGIMEFIFGKDKGISIYMAVTENVGRWIYENVRWTILF